MTRWHMIAMAMGVCAVALGALGSFCDLSVSPAADQVVVVSLPPEPVDQVSPRQPDSPPVYQAPQAPLDGPDPIGTAIEILIPGTSVEPLPGIDLDVQRAGVLMLFVPRFEGPWVPLDRSGEPDLGEDHPTPDPLPPLKRKPAPARALVVAPHLPPPPALTGPVVIPPVEYRWQTLLARLKPVADWRDLAFRGN
jgi:hypothetical protein